LIVAEIIFIVVIEFLSWVCLDFKTRNAFIFVDVSDLAIPLRKVKEYNEIFETDTSLYSINNLGF